MAVLKIYDVKEDSLKLKVTLSNLGDINEQIHQLWQQMNFLLQQYCTKCKITFLMKSSYLIWKCELECCFINTNIIHGACIYIYIYMFI